MNDGAAYVIFLSEAGLCLSHQRLSKSTGGFTAALLTEDRFGIAVEGGEDMNHDGVRDVIVGAFTDDDAGSNTGSIYIVNLNFDGTALNHQKISASSGGFTADISDEDRLGHSVKVIGDLNNDSVLDLLATSFMDDDGNTDVGAIYILFLRSDACVLSHQKISSLAGQFTGQLSTGARFGISSASVGDLNGDNVPDVAVGADYEDATAGTLFVIFLGMKI